MLSKGKLSQIRTGHRNVHNVKDVSEDDIIKLGNDIIYHADMYSFETPDLMSERLATINDIGDTDNINNYLAKLPEDVLSGDNKTTYGKLFELGAKYGSAKNNSDVKPNLTKEVKEVEVEEIEELGSNEESKNEVPNTQKPGMDDKAKSGDVAGEGADVLDTINNKNPEEEQQMNAIEQLQEEAMKTGIGSEVATNVTQVSKDDKLAAKKVIEGEQTSRINYSKEAKITKVLVTKIDREKKATKGRNAIGRVSNPVKARETFISKTGCTVEEGVVRFSKLHSSETHDNAMKMYNILEEACNNPELTIEPYFGKEGTPVPVSIKGVVLEDPSKKEITLAQRDIASHILKNAFLFLDVASKDNAQFQLDAATARGGKEPKKSYVVRIANKANLVEDKSVVVEVKTINDKIVSETKTGYRSALTVSCIDPDKLDGNGHAKKTSWRIPLEVEQFEVETDENYSDLFRAGVGNTVKPISAESAADIANIVDKISILIATESNKAESILGASLLTQLNEEKGKIASESADAINKTIGNEIDEDEFEA